MNTSQQPARRLLVALSLGILALTACNSTPSTKRVALDVVETLNSVSETQKECMRERIDGYPNSTLEAIGNAQENQALDFPDADALENATPELQEFVDDLGDCITAGG
ncbi:MAG: hypothetical protein M3337_03720 [Actinomycetota bacterium]|nr:hypothetical protein [Actinomycetota bacterium]